MVMENNSTVMKQSAYTGFRIFVIWFGRLTLAIAIVVSFAPCLYLWLVEDLFPGWTMIWQSFFPIILTWFLLWITEPISYFPILGITGTYVSWLSGNIHNLRVPCSVIAQQAVGVEEGSEEGDVISALGLCASVIVNLIIVALFAVAGTQILAVIPVGMKIGFDYALPAVTGSLMFTFMLRNWKVGVIAIVMAVLLNVLNLPYAFNLSGVIFSTIIISVFLLKKGILK